MNNQYSFSTLTLPEGFKLYLFSISRSRRQVLTHIPFLFRFWTVSISNTTLLMQELMKNWFVILIQRNWLWNSLKRRWMSGYSFVYNLDCDQAETIPSLYLYYCWSSRCQEWEDLRKAYVRSYVLWVSPELLQLWSRAVQCDLRL